ncbi:MAG: CoA transferase [Pseudomonadales bacterium]|nr:CoA transferase [Pseudomonadales bacterium]MCP5167443.1 CoA transferase [Pseudomonadales bacterium]MCP5186983.1 CoA transferase [Pseudomonadales bacterium]
MTSVVLGPYACQMLGDLGADVIKIEPPGGDTNRNLGPHRNHRDMGSLYLTCNRNKRSVALDLKSARGRNAALDIIKTADVVVHNFRPQAMQRLGLDYPAVQAVNPQVVYCATYGYSRKGPYGNKGALDDSIQAASGIAVLQSMVEGEPRYLPTIIADKTTAMVVVQSVLAALFHRERSGEGQEIEVPMFESMVSFVMTEHLWGQTFEPPIGTAGYVRLMAKHRRPYKTRDGLYLAVLPYWDNHWRTFCELAGRPELAEDERFIDMATRLQNINQSYRVTGEIIATRDRADWLALLGETNVPMMVVNTLDDLIDDPHLVESGFWQEAEHPTEGRVRMSSPPMNFGRTPASIRAMAPRLGEHSQEILREAGLDQATIDSMLAAGEVVLPAQN